MYTLHAHCSDCIIPCFTHVQTFIMRIDAYSIWLVERGFRTFTIARYLLSRACKSRYHLCSYNVRKRLREGREKRGERKKRRHVQTCFSEAARLKTGRINGLYDGRGDRGCS